MARYFTSDLHFGSTLINKYANRPYVSAEDAMLAHVININETCTEDDLLIHVGDFMLNGADRHGEVEDRGLDYSRNHYIKKLFPRVFLLSGNHDDGHNCEADAKSLTLNLNQNYYDVTVGHYPSVHENYRYYGNNNRRSCKRGVHIHLCGHVHDKWMLYYDGNRNVLNINVGTDVWNYKPVEDVELTKMLDFLFANGSHLFPSLNPTSFVWNRDRWEKWVMKIRGELAEAREQRKQEKHAKKGLTPEECERRRIEAMKKKGLIK